ncbi:hypothetical protein NX801_23730 [Streptomyces sp. LP05-1]|uniref:Secreted protein n=1 Tax=Streptomyces pyxinae TaxID=2970734 RepID=A0ABT2CPN6_9ACTN|nr:hypothetical protein [Streptomyces sp. LP05-1]MCS0638611.1 hypothetical protein [Streptomyces sp. LP05-1]
MRFNRLDRLGRPISVLGATAALGAVLMLGAQPAAADGSVRNPGGEAGVDFASYGEIFTVHDYKANGVATVGQIDIKSGGNWLAYDDVINTKGYDGPPVKVNYSIGEGTQVRYRACQYSGSAGAYDCSGWHYDKA